MQLGRISHQPAYWDISYVGFLNPMRLPSFSLCSSSPGEPMGSKLRVGVCKRWFDTTGVISGQVGQVAEEAMGNLAAVCRLVYRARALCDQGSL
jgi:hypothetical protein